MVGRLRPIPRILQHQMALEPTRQIITDPDMIEPSATISRAPIPRAIGPPSVELLIYGHEMAQRVMPASRLLPAEQPCNFDGCMGDDIQ